MHHNRVPKIVSVPIHELTFDPAFDSDKRFITLYQQYFLGKLKVAITRLPISLITSGYYDRHGKTTIRISNLKPGNAERMERMIRTGWRPPLMLYWTPLAPGNGGYVCSDDEAALSAYSSLNFTLVPCIILNPKRVDASEASIWIEQRGDHSALAHAVAPIVDKYACFIGGELPAFADLARFPIDKCQTTRAAVIAFHKAGSEVHYHQMLHALLRRHERLLDSIREMVRLSRAEHAVALTRIAYEAFLNFYLDWLSPEFFGPRLQLLAAIRDAQSHGIHTLDDNLSVLTNFVHFLENVSGKARVSPLGSFFHDTIYPPLSLVTHQSYIHLESEASEFVDPPGDPSSRAQQVGRWLDILTTALVLRVRNDVGISEEAIHAGHE